MKGPDKRSGATEKRKRKIRGWLIKGAITLVIGLGIWLARQPLADLLAFVRDQESASAYIKGYGIWGPGLVTMLQFLQVILAFIPGHVLCIASGYVYGFPAGFALNLLTTIAAGQIAFTLARWAGRPLVNRLVPAESVARWDGVAERHGFVFFLTCFLLPVFATDVMNFVAGLSSISGKKFLVASLLGRIPGMIVLSFVGSRGMELASIRISPLVWVGIALVSILLFVAWRYLFIVKLGGLRGGEPEAVSP
jgi:uncharacterized membrane protein YdjX (TVP38/TMEM64 family)